MVKVRAAVVCLVPGVWAACPTGYEGPDGGGCFMMSERTGTFLECEAECESKGGTLASIRSASEDDFVRSLAGQRAVYLGLFEAGEDESGDWQWVDGFDGSYRAWNPGDPNEWCTDEDCAVFAPSKFADWVDASCTARCLCRSGGIPSKAFGETKALLADNAHDYEHCLEKTTDKGDEGTRYCRVNGLNTEDWDPKRIAYHDDDGEHSGEWGGGYAPGTCGFAAWEHDEQWAICCCVDDTFCCPRGEDPAICLSAEDEDEDEDEDEWEDEDEEDSGVAIGVADQFEAVNTKLNIILGLQVVAAVAGSAFTFYKFLQARTAASDVVLQARGVELSTNYNHLDRTVV